MAAALLDTNVLVHAVYRGAPLHRQAAVVVEHALRETGRYCTAAQNLIEFAAVVTRARFVSPPLPFPELARVVTQLYRSRKLKKIYPQRRTAIRAIREGVSLAITGPAWYDLYLAVTMRDAGIDVIVTENVEDFARFPFVTVRRLSDIPL